MLKTVPSRTVDHAATGANNRKRRLKANLSLREVAQELGISAPYLSDLERGRRNWTEHFDDHYAAALNRLIKS